MDDARSGLARMCASAHSVTPHKKGCRVIVNIPRDAEAERALSWPTEVGFRCVKAPTTKYTEMGIINTERWARPAEWDHRGECGAAPYEDAIHHRPRIDAIENTARYGPSPSCPATAARTLGNPDTHRCMRMKKREAPTRFSMAPNPPPGGGRPLGTVMISGWDREGLRNDSRKGDGGNRP